MSIHRVCSACLSELGIDAFGRSKSSKDGLLKRCKSCVNAYAVANYKSNPERGRMYARKSRALHSKARNAYAAKWRQENHERFRALMGEWKQANKSKVVSYVAARRAIEKSSVAVWADSEFERFAIQEAYALSDLRTEVVGIPFHVDHIVPLRGKTVCGLHCAANLQVIPAKGNMAKSNRHWPGMP